MNKENLTYNQSDIEDIIKCLQKNLNEDNYNLDTKYFKSYFEFIKYFERIDSIDYHSFVIGSYFSYGWMPTVLKNFDKNDNIKSIITILNKIKSNIEIKDEEYLLLVKSINNSIVGVSKLLHFINPKQYPIFDSRIKNYFKQKGLVENIYKTNYYNKNKPELKYTKDIQQYKLFKSLCLDIISSSKFNDIYDKSIIKLHLNNRLTKIRVLENLFFYFGGNNDS